MKQEIIVLFVDDFLQIVFYELEMEIRKKFCFYDCLDLANTPHNQLY